MGKLSLMKGTNMPDGAELGSRKDSSGSSVTHYKVPELGRVGPKP